MFNGQTAKLIAKIAEALPTDLSSDVMQFWISKPEQLKGALLHLRIGTSMPSFDKFQVRQLLELIIGNEDGLLTVDQFSRWRNLILFMVSSMRLRYMVRDDASAKLYAHHWVNLDSADNSAQVVEALNGLLLTIRYD